MRILKTLRTWRTLPKRRKQFIAYAGIGFLLTLLFAAVWFNPHNLPDNYHGWSNVFDIFLFLTVTYILWHQITSELLLWLVAKDMKLPPVMNPAPGKRVAFITAFVPGKEPYELLERSLLAMRQADYPHDTWILDEGNDPYVKEICARMGVKHFSRKGIERYNTTDGKFKAKTKGGNHNAWHDAHGKDYDFVAQIDIDFIPRRDFLTKTLGYFRDPTVGFVGSPQIYGNTDESWIARGAAEQAYTFYGPIQKGLYGSGMHIFIGANHVVRVSALEHVGGYAGHIIEDHLTGLRLYTKGWKSVYVPEKLAVGEGPATWDAYFGQQMRWAYGLVDVLLHHSPKLLPILQPKHAWRFYLLQQHYFGGLAQALGVALMSLYFMFGIQTSRIAIVPMLLVYLPLLAWQYFLNRWLQRFSIDPEGESGMRLHGMLASAAAWPIYFMATVRALAGRPLVYRVTPKGTQLKQPTDPGLFMPHFVLGSITLIDLLLAVITGRRSAVLVYFAIINTVVMYGLVASVLVEWLPPLPSLHQLRVLSTWLNGRLFARDDLASTNE